MRTQVFNLEKIKEITSPLEILQGRISNLDRIYESFIDKKETFTQILLDKDFLENFEKVSQSLKEIYENLTEISKENANKFIIFQEYLIKKYKEIFKEEFEKLQVNQDFSKKIGLFLIENKKICEVVKSSFIPAISLNEYLDLLDSLFQNVLFLSTVETIKKFYSKLIENKLEIELRKITEDVDPILIIDYKKAFKKDQITFKTFVSSIESKLTQEELERKNKLIQKTKEKKKLNELKKTQVEQQKSYQDYFNLSPKEFKRRLRKKKREKLPDIVDNSKIGKKTEISEEVTEKIEIFKSKFAKSFEEKYLIQRDDEKDPLELIRERSKKKQEEYKDFIKKFDDNKDMS